MPPDFHITHVKLCLKRSARRYRRLYSGNSRFQPEELLKRELAYFPCGRKAWLYAAVRLLKPARVVETGVWFGFSTSQILQALSDNGFGKLFSVDTPNIAYDAGSYWDAKYLPNGKEPGFVIPPTLLDRWELVRGYSKDVLPRLLESIGSIDFFYHDSEHTYATMMFEYHCAWGYLTEGGILCSDDVDTNPAFSDFHRLVGGSCHVVQGHGVIIKTGNSGFLG